MNRVQTIEQRLAELERIVFAQYEWQPLTKAAEILDCSPQLLSLRCRQHPNARWWRWNHTKTRRQIHIRKYQEAFRK